MENWNYTLPIPQPIWDSQKDWNQTLLTKFNMLCVGIHTEIVIKVPQKLKSLIDSLEFYNPLTNKIGSRFIVEFVESDNNIIYVGESELEVENFEMNANYNV